jgi:uncharacterized protein
VGKKVKVVFDTNVWISIFMNKRLKDDFLRIKQNITVYISDEIALEILKVLHYPKILEILRKLEISERDILRIIANNSKRVVPTVKLCVIEEDSTDNIMLECAMAAGANVIVSGDKHLLSLGKYKKTRVMVPREFFDSID